MGRHRMAPDTQKAAALARLTANRGNILRTARELDLPESTLRGWNRAAKSAEGSDLTRLRREQEGTLAEKFEKLAHLCLDAVTPEKIAEASLLELTKCAAIAIDKWLLLTEQPTVIIRYVEITAEERRARLAELLETGRQRELAAKNGQGPNSA